MAASDAVRKKRARIMRRILIDRIPDGAVDYDAMLKMYDDELAKWAAVKASAEADPRKLVP